MPGSYQKFPGLRALVALCCCLALGAHAEIFTARVIVVMDGDTLMVLRDGHKTKIRLAEIDAPEVGHAGMGGVPPNSQKEQPFGRQSRESLKELVGRKQVRVQSRAVDRYGRIIGLVSVDGLDVNQEQVRRGYAWAGERSQPTYPILQNEARQAGRGLWGQGDPLQPWLWRKQHPSVQQAPAHDTLCGDKHRCAQMDSCEEARFYFTRCGIKSLDSNGDGLPCAKLCDAKP
jgi:endonuclease YncB( thermonuclease family)